MTHNLNARCRKIVTLSVSLLFSKMRKENEKMSILDFYKKVVVKNSSFF